MTLSIYNHPERFELTAGRALWSADGEVVPVCRILGAAAGMGAFDLGVYPLDDDCPIDEAIDPTVELLTGDYDTAETPFERAQAVYNGTDARSQPFTGYDRMSRDYL